MRSRVGVPGAALAGQRAPSTPNARQKSSDLKGVQLLGWTRTESATAFTAHLSWSQEYVPSARATTDARMTPIWPPDTSWLDVVSMGTRYDGGVSMFIHKVAEPGWQNERRTRDTSALEHSRAALLQASKAC